MKPGQLDHTFTRIITLSISVVQRNTYIYIYIYMITHVIPVQQKHQLFKFMIFRTSWFIKRLRSNYGWYGVAGHKLGHWWHLLKLISMRLENKSF